MISPFFTFELKSALIFTTLPDTTDPTWTVVTGLIVPVACTTCEMSPFSTLAVKYCALDRVPREIVPSQSISAMGGATSNARCSIDRFQYSFIFPMNGPMVCVPSTIKSGRNRPCYDQRVPGHMIETMLSARWTNLQKCFPDGSPHKSRALRTVQNLCGNLTSKLIVRFVLPVPALLIESAEHILELWLLLRR